MALVFTWLLLQYMHYINTPVHVYIASSDPALAVHTPQSTSFCAQLCVSRNSSSSHMPCSSSPDCLHEIWSTWRSLSLNECQASAWLTSERRMSLRRSSHDATMFGIE